VVCNDDFDLVFDAKLEVFDALSNSLGFVSLNSNLNGFTDQFLALQSDTPFRSAHFSYQRPQDKQLSIYLDDFMFSSGTSSPEPSAYALIAAGL